MSRGEGSVFEEYHGDVGLVAVGERGVFRSEPGQETGRGFDLQPGVGGVGAGR